MSSSEGNESGSRRLLASSSFKAWEKILIAVAACLLVGGVGARVVSAIGGSEESSGRSSGGDTSAKNRMISGNSLVDGGGNDGTVTSIPFPGSSPKTTETETASAEDAEVSPAMLRGGFGFFAGFSIGMALRAFFRLTSIIAGVTLLLLFGLQYIGWIDVRWDVVQDQFNAWTEGFSREFGNFKTFIAGSLPTVGLSGLGLFTGFRKR